jgi:hypothetical protein
MFQLDADRRFLTSRDVVLASLYNEAVLKTEIYQNYEDFRVDEFGNRQRYIRRDTKFLGWMLEDFRNEIPYTGSGTRNYYSRSQVGFHIVDQIYLVAVHVCMTNVDFRNSDYTYSQTKPTFLFTGDEFWGQAQFETKSDMGDWFSRLKTFYQTGHIEMTIF